MEFNGWPSSTPAAVTTNCSAVVVPASAMHGAAAGSFPAAPRLAVIAGSGGWRAISQLKSVGKLPAPPRQVVRRLR